MNKNPVISLIRVLAMFSIIIGHYLSMINVNHFQFGAIGVEIFLFISGWLYGDKQIEQSGKWFFGRIKRILVPYWIVLSFVVLLRIVFKQENNILSVVLFYLNLQGVNKVLRFITYDSIAGMGHTWFLTVLMICYVLMIFIKKEQKIEKKIRENRIKAVAVAFVVQVILAIFHIQIVRILCFFIGYFWNKETILNKKNYISISLLMIVSTVGRFLIYLMADGTTIYDYIVFGWSFVFLGIWLVQTCYMLCNKNRKAIVMLVNSRGLEILDYLSYPMFLSHYIFISGYFAINKYVSNYILQLVLILLFSFSISCIVDIISDRKSFIKKMVRK